MTPIGMVRLSPSAKSAHERAIDIIQSSRLDHQSQHVALYVVSTRQGPDGVSLRDVAEGTGWGRTAARQAMVDMVQEGIVEPARVFCSYCSSPVVGGDVHIDHVVARSLGGTDAPDNRVPTCKTCNSRKSNKPFLVWLIELGRRG